MGARSVQSRVSDGQRGLGGRALRALCGLGLLGLACAPQPRERGTARSRPTLAELTARADAEAPAPSTPVAAAIAPRTETLHEPEPEPVRTEPFELTFVGDVILGRYREDGYDPIPEGEHELFDEVAPLMESDLLIGNLETPLASSIPDHSPVGTRYSFGADAKLARHLADGRFDVMSLANNHAYDLRGAGVEQTPQILAQLGIIAVGSIRADAPPIRVETVERDGWRVGIVALTTRANIPSLDDLPPLPLVEVTEIESTVAPLVEQARSTHDLVVVLAHWGEEYADTPLWEQRQAAQALVEAGADLVIGHHPHVLQGIERHGHGLIAYSLGNFVFENVKDIPRLSGVLRVRYSAQGCLEDSRVHPVFIKSIPIKHPVPATGYMGRQVKERLQSLSHRFGTRWTEQGDDLRIEGPACPGRGEGTSG